MNATYFVVVFICYIYSLFCMYILTNPRLSLLFGIWRWPVHFISFLWSVKMIYIINDKSKFSFTTVYQIYWSKQKNTNRSPFLNILTPLLPMMWWTVTCILRYISYVKFRISWQLTFRLLHNSKRSQKNKHEVYMELGRKTVICI